MFRPLCWTVIISQVVQVRRLYSVQIVAVNHTSKLSYIYLAVIMFCVAMSVYSINKLRLKCVGTLSGEWL